jgi:hypothetical protein
MCRRHSSPFCLSPCAAVFCVLAVSFAYAQPSSQPAKPTVKKKREQVKDALDDDDDDDWPSTKPAQQKSAKTAPKKESTNTGAGQARESINTGAGQARESINTGAGQARESINIGAGQARESIGKKDERVPKPDVARVLDFQARTWLRYAVDFAHDSPRSADAPLFREDVNELLMTAQLGMTVRPRKSLRLVGGAQLRLRVTSRRPQTGPYYGLNGDLHRTDFEVIPRDSYLEWSQRYVDLRVGLLTIVWGANDLVNPNDVLSVRDLRFGVLDQPEALKQPQLMAHADIFVGPVQVGLSWAPIFTPYRADLFGSDYGLFSAGVPEGLQLFGALADGLFNDTVEGFAQPLLLATERPRPLLGSTLGIKLSTSLGGWDLAVQVAFRYQPLPILQIHRDLVLALLPLLPDAQSGQLDRNQLIGALSPLFDGRELIRQTFSRQYVAGLSVTRAFWKLVFELDMTFLSGRAEALSQGDVPGLPLVGVGNGSPWFAVTIDTKVLTYTFGARYTYGQDLAIKLEWWHELLLDPLMQTEKERRELLLGGPHRGGLANLIQYQLGRYHLAFQLLTHAELFNKSLVISPRVAYSIGDHFKIAAGATIFAGKRGPGALYDVADQGYIELEGLL